MAWEEPVSENAESDVLIHRYTRDFFSLLRISFNAPIMFALACDTLPHPIFVPFGIIALVLDFFIHWLPYIPSYTQTEIDGRIRVALHEFPEEGLVRMSRDAKAELLVALQRKQRKKE